MWPANKKIRVMVVDDSIMARTMITNGLSKHPRISRMTPESPAGDTWAAAA